MKQKGIGKETDGLLQKERHEHSDKMKVQNETEIRSLLRSSVPPPDLPSLSSFLPSFLSNIQPKENVVEKYIWPNID